MKPFELADINPLVAVGHSITLTQLTPSGHTETYAGKIGRLTLSGKRLDLAEITEVGSRQFLSVRLSWLVRLRLARDCHDGHSDKPYLVAIDSSLLRCHELRVEITKTQSGYFSRTRKDTTFVDIQSDVATIRTPFDQVVTISKNPPYPDLDYDKM